MMNKFNEYEKELLNLIPGIPFSRKKGLTI